MKKIILFCFSICFNILCAANNDIITLNLSNPTHPGKFVLEEEKGFWVETYNNAEEYRQIEFDLFALTHNPSGFGGNDIGEGLSYWDGFTYCTSGDTIDYGIKGSSDSWMSHQWGCMAGGGIKTNANGKVMTGTNGKVVVDKGIPYLVAYWGYWIEMNQGGAPCLQVNFTDKKPYIPVGIYICNHPWPYYSNIRGDGFTSGLTEEGDYFKITIHGMNENGEDTGAKVDHILAGFKNGKLYQSPDWQWVDLSELGTVYGIYFTMESSDIHNIIELGPNTAVYFCMDKLQVRPVPENTTPSRPAGLHPLPGETTIELSWNAASGTVGVKGYNLYLDGEWKTFVENTQYTFTGLLPYTEYQIGVEAIARNETLSEKTWIKVKTTDESPPTIPTELTGTTTKYTISISWNASTDNVGVTEYHIYLNGERQKRITSTSWILEGLDPGTSYFVEVEARDDAGNRSKRAYITLLTEKNETDMENIENVKIRIYPNPVKNYLYVDAKDNQVKAVTISAMDGKSIHSETTSQNKIIIPATNWDKGIYTVTIQTDKTFFTHKVVKQ